MTVLAPLYLVIFVSFCGYALMVTLFVPMIMGGSGFVAEGASTATRSMLVGLLLAAYPFGQFFGSPLIGAISDRYGRRPVLIGSLIVAVAAYAAVALGIEQRALGLIAMACLIGGFAESNIAVAQSSIADVASADQRPRLFGWIYSCCSAGYIVGPLIGGQIAARMGWSAPFWVLVPVLAATLLWVWVKFGETRPSTPSAAFGAISSLAALVTIFGDHRLRRLYLLNFLVFLSMFGYFRSVLIYIVDRWHTSVDCTTAIYAGIAVISGLASFGAMGPLSRALGLHRLAAVSALIGGMAMASIVVPASMESIWITAGIATFAGTLTLASAPALLANAAEPERQGRVLGSNQAIQVGSEAVSAAMGGALAGLLLPLPLMLFGGVLVLVGGLLLVAPRVPKGAQ